MTLGISPILVILALICFGIGACSANTGRFNTIVGGLFLWALSTLVHG